MRDASPSSSAAAHRRRKPADLQKPSLAFSPGRHHSSNLRGRSVEIARNVKLQPESRLLMMGKKNKSLNEIRNWGNYDPPLVIRFRAGASSFHKKSSI